MTVAVTTKALQTKLVTLANFKEAVGITVTTDDVFLGKLIDRVSSMFDQKCRRRFAREVITETFNGNSRTDIIVSRFPVVSLDALTLDGLIVAATEYKVLDADAGILFMETGWSENIATATGITVLPLPMPGDTDYSLSYTAGFLLPGDNITTAVAIASDTVGKTFTLSAGRWPLLVAGDVVAFAGFPTDTLNDDFTVVTRTDLVLTVSETPGATEAGAEVTMTCQTLPNEVEDAVISIVNSRFAGRGRDRAVKAEKIGDYSVTYGSSAMSDEDKEVIRRYSVIF